MKKLSQKLKEPVILRERKLKDGNFTLYLAINHNGKRKYEYLSLYIYENPATKEERDKNKHNLQLANSIKAKRIIEIQNNEYGFQSHFKQEMNFLDYFGKMADERKESLGNYSNWISCLKHLKLFCHKDTTFKDIDEEFVSEFKKFLSEPHGKNKRLLSANSKHSYFAKFTACLKAANASGIIPINPAKNVAAPKAENPQRNYLTIDEVKDLMETECRYPVLKNAFLFSCLTGLRWSDINKLTWDMVQVHEGVTRLVFRQKKTTAQEYLDINEQALQFLGEREGLKDRVFVGLKYSAWHNVAITKWCLKAGITKDITFHSARHTFAVMMIGLGVEIFTVSKLLGHEHLKTTQIYTKVLDKSKQHAISKIPDLSKI